MEARISRAIFLRKEKRICTMCTVKGDNPSENCSAVCVMPGPAHMKVYIMSATCDY